MLFSRMIGSMGFKENLKSELASQDMLVKELAALSGISKHTLDNYLNVREYMPSADAAVKIAQALGVSVEYLVTGSSKAEDQMLQSPEVRAVMRNLKYLDQNDRQLIADIVQLYRNRRKNRPAG